MPTSRIVAGAPLVLAALLLREIGLKNESLARKILYLAAIIFIFPAILLAREKIKKIKGEDKI